MESYKTSSADALHAIRRRYYSVRLFDAIGPSFIFAIYPLFLRARGLNQFEINCVAATYFLVTFMTDIPTGAFADAVGRRASYVMGCMVSAASYALYFFASHYATFLIAETIRAIGGTLRNGAADAWAIDALDAAGHLGPKDVIFSRVAQLFSFGAMMGALVGAYSARIDIALPFLFGVAGNIMMALVGWAQMRGEARGGHAQSAGSIVARIRMRMIVGVREGLHTRTILMLALANAITVAAWAPQWFEWPLFFNAAFHRGPQVVGWLYGLFAVAALIGSEICARITLERSSRAGFLASGVTIQSVCFLGAGILIGSTWMVMAFFFAANLLAGILGPLYMSWYNEQIDEAHRATMLSFQTTFTTFGSAAGLPGGGVIADRFGLAVAWRFGGVLAALAMPIYLALRPLAEAAIAEVD
jgi:MFS family permease